MNKQKVNQASRAARIAGVLYLLVAIFSGFAAYVRSNLIVSGNAVATAKNIIASETLFRAGIVSDLVGQVFHVLLALALYELFKSVSKKQAMFMLVLALVPVPIAMLNQLNQFAALPFLNGTDYSQIMFFLNLHTYGIFIAQIFWGLWLFPLGYLVMKSDFMPKVLGILLAIAGLGYLVDSFGKLLFSNYSDTIAQVTFIGEVLFLLWLLIKGIKTKGDRSLLEAQSDEL